MHPFRAFVLSAPHPLTCEQLEDAIDEREVAWRAAGGVEPLADVLEMSALEFDRWWKGFWHIDTIAARWRGEPVPRRGWPRAWTLA